MAILGRSRELGAIRSALDRPDSSVVVVSGPRGIGKTELVRAAVAELPHRYHRVPPLPDPQQRAALAATLGLPAGDDRTPPEWSTLLGAATPGGRSGAPFVLVVDDAHRLSESRARFLPALRAGLSAAREAGRLLHVVLVSPEPPVTEDDAELGAAHVRVGPLDFRGAARGLPGADAQDRLRAYAVFGGAPETLRLVDAGVSLPTNLRRLILDPGGPLVDAPLGLLERDAQTPSRYVAILQALAPGESDWGGVHAGVSDVTASGQLAPYLKRLEEMGWIEVRRSLDARPRSRSRRYRIADPFVAFWFRFVFPHRHAFVGRAPVDAVAEAVRGGLDGHVASVLPEVCRQYMRHDALEVLGSNARECGSLWGPGYDIPAAGILGTGAAFYGAPVPAGADGPTILADLDRQVRETRYGFGRQNRIRVLFTPTAAPADLAREAARRDDVVIVDGPALAGEI